MSRADQLRRLAAQDIDQDAAELPRLRDLLREQHLLLLRREVDALAELNRKVSALTAAAEARARRRSKILRAFRLEAGAEGMQRLLASFPEPERGRLQEAWRGLGATLAECQRLNERNGRLLALQQELVQQLLGGADAPYAPASQP